MATRGKGIRVNEGYVAAIPVRWCHWPSIFQGQSVVGPQRQSFPNPQCGMQFVLDLPLHESLSGDHLSMELVRKYAENKFYEHGKPRAPALWPAMPIPISCMQRDELPPKGSWKRYGGDIAVAAFWFAFAAAIKAGADGPELERFRLVARTAGRN